MRQGSNPKRLRGRTGRKNPNPRSQNFESNGPEVRVRGNAQQVVEKYLALARDASSAGDRITAESYFQHAEHYYRVMTANGGGEDRNNQNNRPNGDFDAKAETNGSETNGSETNEAEVNRGATNGAGPRAAIEVVANGNDAPEARENGVAAQAASDKPAQKPPQD